MAHPLIISSGLFRSGSTWLFNVCRALAEVQSDRDSIPVRSKFHRIEELEAFLQSPDANTPALTIIKAHFIGPIAQQWIRDGKAKLIYTIRDPRDCIASDLKFMNLGLEHAVRRTATCLAHSPIDKGLPNTLFVHYEQMMASRSATIEKIAKHLAIDLSPDQIRDIDAKTGIEAAREKCSQIRDLPERQTVSIDRHKVDPHTQLHENHIDSGKVSRWKDDLTPEQGEWLTQLFGDWLRSLGYEPAGHSRI